MADPNSPTPSLLEQLRARVRRIKQQPPPASLVPVPTGPHDDIYREGVSALDEMAQDPGEWAGCEGDDAPQRTEEAE